MLRVVLDTNVLISAIIANGEPRKLLQAGSNGKFKLVTSEGILDEFVCVLERPKFKLRKNEISRVVSALNRSSETVTVRSNFTVIKEDPDDDEIINTAYDGTANYIVSGDAHIRQLKNFKGIKIVSVDEMLGILK